MAYVFLHGNTGPGAPIPAPPSDCISYNNGVAYVDANAVKNHIRSYNRGYASYSDVKYVIAQLRIGKK